MNIKKLFGIIFLFSLIFFCENLIFAKKKKTEEIVSKKIVEQQQVLAVVDDTLGFDEEKKRQEVIALVNKGIEFFQKNLLNDVGRAFNTNPFVEGELYLFVFDFKGSLIAHGEETSLMWKNMIHEKDTFGSLFVADMIQKARSGGGWVTYEWRGAAKQSYVQKVVKDNKEYIIGCGYYPHSKTDTVVSLVKGAVSLVFDTIKKGEPIEKAFGIISYPGSHQFIRGDLYIYSLDDTGLIVVHGERAGLIGTNSLEYKDAKGVSVNKEIFSALEKNPTQGTWIEYTSKGAKKRAYAELVKSSDEKKYFIACGYYPEIEKNDVISLVHKAYAYLKANGKTEAFKLFSDARESDFHLGDLYVLVYDMKGVIVADGSTSIETVGMNVYNKKDEDGHLFVQEIITLAKEKSEGWVDIKLNNSFFSAFIKKIDLGTEEFVIVSGMYPASKADVISLLVKSAVTTFQLEDFENALRMFVESKSTFIRGDLSIFVFDDNGFCYAYGDQTNLIWKNLLLLKDDSGKEFVKLMIESGKNGPTHITFLRDNKTYIAYVQRVLKDGKYYTIGSGFYK